MRKIVGRRACIQAGYLWKYCECELSIPSPKNWGWKLNSDSKYVPCWQEKPVFDIHDPGLRYLFQLRLGLSPLRSHKEFYGFADTPSDTCLCRLGTEDTRHFLLSCPFHATKRTIMVSSVKEILLKNNLNYPTNFPVNELNLYLYGLPTLSSTDNRLILLATIDFIKNTNRFSH